MWDALCLLQLLLALASSVILKSESHGTPQHVGLSQIRDCLQIGGPGPRVHVYAIQEQGDLLYLQALGSLFVFSYDSQCYGGNIITRLHMGWSL
jgi:hypothetical protein